VSYLPRAAAGISNDAAVTAGRRLHALPSRAGEPTPNSIEPPDPQRFGESAGTQSGTRAGSSDESGEPCRVRRWLLAWAELAHMWAAATCSLKYGCALIIPDHSVRSWCHLAREHSGRHE
jgi:hypothetical protein